MSTLAGLVACGQGPSTGHTLASPSASFVAVPSVASPSASVPSPSPTTAPLPKTDPPPYRGAVVAVYGVGMPSGRGAIHVVTASGGVLTDHLLQAPDGFRGVLDANANMVLELDMGLEGGTFDVVTVELTRGTTRHLVNLDALQNAAHGDIAGVLSPDGSQAAVGVAHKLLVFTLATGASRELNAGSSSKWFVLRKWTQAGIYASEVPYEGPAFDVVRIDPRTGSASVIYSPAPFFALSPDGGIAAVATNTNLGDGSGLRYAWFNTLTEIAGNSGGTLVAQQKARNLLPVDVDAAGRILFQSDTDHAATDTGLYLAVGGHPVRQLSAHFSGEWGTGAFVGSSSALVAHTRGGGLDAETAVEVDLVDLCSDTATGCKVTTTTISSTPGTWPTQVGHIVVIGSLA